MIDLQEAESLNLTETFDVSTFHEEPKLGNGIPLALQLKGFNRMDRIGRRKTQISEGKSGSTTERQVANGAVMVIGDLSDLDYLSVKNSDYTINLPDSRGMVAHNDDIYIGSVDRVIHLNAQTGRSTPITNPWFAFIHSLQLADDGKSLLVTSPGFDRIIQLDTGSGKPTWEWSAWSNGYPNTVNSHKTIVTNPDDVNKIPNALLISRPQDYPGGLGLPPGDRTAFPNSATYKDGTHILATLFHNGLIKIDTTTGKSTHVLGGLSHPHGIRKYKSGFVVTDTGHGAYVTLDNDLQPVKHLSFANLSNKTPEAGSAEWLQNVVPLNENLLAAVDSNRASIFILDPENSLIRRVPYDPNWVMQEVCPLESQTFNKLKVHTEEANLQPA